ncbi:MAG: oligosaccharide flippase family protein, partial [Bacteroidota bacterium]
VKGAYLLGVEREVQNILPRGDYGLYFSLFNFSMLLQLIADFGLQLYNSRNLAGHRQLLAKYFPYFLSLKLALALAFLLCLMLGGWLLGYWATNWPLLLIVGSNQLLMSWMLFLRSNLTGIGRYRTDSWMSIVDKVLMLVFVGSLVLFAKDQLTVTRFALAQTLSWLLSIALVTGLLANKLERFLPRWNGAIAFSFLRKAAPFALAVFLMTAYTRTDAVMIERLLEDGSEQADHYAAAYRLLDAVNMIGYLLSGLLLPMFARQIARKESVVDLLRLSLPIVLTGSIVIAMSTFVFAKDIIFTLYDFGNGQTISILQLLIFSFVAMCINYVYGALLGAADQLRWMNYIFLAGCLLNIIGNAWYIPRNGAVGAAMVTLITQSFIAVAQLVLAHVRLKLSWLVLPWWRFL